MEIVLLVVLVLGMVGVAIIVNRARVVEEERIRIAKEKAAEEERIRMAKEKAAEEERIRIAKERAAEEEKKRKAKSAKEKGIRELRISNQYCPVCKQLAVDVYTDGSGDCCKCDYTSVQHKNEPLPSSERGVIFTDLRDRGWW